VTTTVVDGEQIDSGGITERRGKGTVEFTIESLDGGGVRVVVMSS